MRLVDFLIALLQTHAHALQRLAALFGEDVLIEILENQPEPPEFPDPRKSARPSYSMSDFKNPPLRGVGGFGGSYSELETTVQNLRLPTMLEFHLWAYPPYRAFIESGLSLDATVAKTETTENLVKEVIEQATQWVRQLPLPPEFSLQAERATEVAWIRFRTEMLQGIGKRPLGSIQE